MIALSIKCLYGISNRDEAQGTNHSYIIAENIIIHIKLWQNFMLHTLMFLTNETNIIFDELLGSHDLNLQSLIVQNRSSHCVGLLDY